MYPWRVSGGVFDSGGTLRPYYRLRPARFLTCITFPLVKAMPLWRLSYSFADSRPFGCGASALVARPFKHIYHHSSGDCRRVTDNWKQPQLHRTGVMYLLTYLLWIGLSFLILSWLLFSAYQDDAVSFKWFFHFLCHTYCNVGTLLCTEICSTHIVIIKLCHVVSILWDFGGHDRESPTGT